MKRPDSGLCPVMMFTAERDVFNSKDTYELLAITKLSFLVTFVLLSPFLVRVYCLPRQTSKHGLFHGWLGGHAGCT